MSDGGPDGPPPPYYSFDRVAAEYEATRYMPARMAAVAAGVICRDLRPEEWLLDAGIGTGRLGRALAESHGPRTVGIDVSAAMMREMRRRGARHGMRAGPALAQADLRALPFADSVFQGIVILHVLHLIADWRGAVGEAWRTLRPGGALFLGVERRSRTLVREFYLREAERVGALSPGIGLAHSAEVCDTLRSWGARIEEHRPPELAWEHPLPIRDTLAMLDRRTYSVLWSIPEEIHRRLMRETTRYAREHFGTLEHVEEASIRMVLFEARKNKRPG